MDLLGTWRVNHNNTENRPQHRRIYYNQVMPTFRAQVVSQFLVLQRDFFPLIFLILFNSIPVGGGGGMLSTIPPIVLLFCLT